MSLYGDRGSTLGRNQEEVISQPLFTNVRNLEDCGRELARMEAGMIEAARAMAPVVAEINAELVAGMNRLATSYRDALDTIRKQQRHAENGGCVTNYTRVT